MTKEALLHLSAGDLYQAVALAVPAKRRRVPLKRPIPISLAYNREAGGLMVSDARYGRSSQAVVAQGVWPSRVQADGERLRVLLGKYAATEHVGLMATHTEIAIVAGKSRISLPRTDVGRKAVEERPLPPIRGHKGKPYQAPDPIGKKVEWGDTWLFSARVPMPQHRESKKRS